MLLNILNKSQKTSFDFDHFVINNLGYYKRWFYNRFLSQVFGPYY